MDERGKYLGCSRMQDVIGEATRLVSSDCEAMRLDPRTHISMDGLKPKVFEVRMLEC